MGMAPADSLTTSPLQVIARVPHIAATAQSPAPGQPEKAPAKPADDVGALVALLLQSVATGTACSARQQLVDGLAKIFGATGVAIGWQRPGQTHWRVAVSGQAPVDQAPDQRSEIGRGLQAAFAETWLQNQPLEWPTNQGERGTPPTYRQLGELTSSAQVCGTPLGTANTTSPAVMLIWGNLGPVNKFRAGSSGALLREPIAGLIRILDAATPDAWSSAAAALAALVRRRRWFALIAISLLIAVSLVPVPDRVNCSATLEPQLRRYVVSPIDGTLEKSLVRTGDQVTAGQTLAQLDPRPLQMELSVLRGELDEATKRRAAAQAKGQAALTQLAALEGEQITAKIAHLQHQLAQLTVVSPLAGVVVRGELERVEGAPLARGNSMFEIAPLQQLVAEVAIPEDEVQLVEAGMKVTLWPAALPGQSIEGTISCVHPRAEIRERQSIFIADVVLDNKQDVLRPGMQAQAVVWSRSESLGWTLVRRPYFQLTRWIWW